MARTTFSGPVKSDNGFESAGAITVLSGAAPAAGGAAAILATSSNIGVYIGSTVPTGITAAKGSLFINAGATTTTTRLYINTDGGTTWASFTASA